MRKWLWVTTLCIALMVIQTTSSYGQATTDLRSDKQSVAAADSARTLTPGPYVEAIRYVRYPTYGSQYLALEAGEIELTVDPLYPYTYQPIDMTDYDVFYKNSSSYFALILNERHYPYNITEFRRAISLAIDKASLAEDAYWGYGTAQDSHISANNPWFMEDEFETRYTENQSALGNQILDDLGFEIDPTTGWRNCSNGEALRVLIEHGDNDMHRLIANHIVDALNSLHIDAWESGPTFGDHLCDCCGHIYFETVMYSINMPLNELVDYFWSGYNGSIWERSPVLNNATYDFWREEYVNAVSEEEAEEAIRQIQVILHEQIPIIPLFHVCYPEYVRTDKFQGFVADPREGAAGFWTARNARQLANDHEGVLNIGVGSEPNTFNPFHGGTRTAELIMDNLYSSLFRRGPDGSPIPDLASSMVAERHSDDPGVPEGHLRYTIAIVGNATWSDGVPLTAQDIVGTFLYILESGTFGNPASEELATLQTALSMSPYTVRLEFDSESYLIFEKFAYTKIIPYHIFFGEGSPGAEGWYDWDPFLTAGQPHVTCGPFLFSEYIEYEYVELIRNPYYHWRLTPRVEFSSLVVTGLPPGGNPPPPPESTHYYAEWKSSIPLTGPFILEANGSLFSTGTWEGDSLAVNVDSLWGKTYSLHLYVNDSFGHSYENMTSLYVIQPWTTSTTNTSSGMALITLATTSVSVVSSAVIITMVFLSYRKKRLFQQSVQANET